MRNSDDQYRKKVLKVPETLLKMASLRSKKEEWYRYILELKSRNEGKKVDSHISLFIERELSNVKDLPKFKHAVIFHYRIQPIFSNGKILKSQFSAAIQSYIGVSKGTASKNKNLLISYGLLREEGKYYVLTSVERLWSICGIFSTHRNEKGRIIGRGKGIFYYKPKGKGKQLKYNKQIKIQLVKIWIEDKVFCTDKDFVSCLSDEITQKAFYKEKAAIEEGRSRRSQQNDIESLRLSCDWYTEMLGFTSNKTGCTYRKCLSDAGIIKVKKNRTLVQGKINLLTAQRNYEELGLYSENYEGYLRWERGCVWAIHGTYFVSHLNFIENTKKFAKKASNLGVSKNVEPISDDPMNNQISFESNQSFN